MFLSKIFVREDPPVLEGLKQFIPAVEHAASSDSTVFKMDWPAFQTGEVSFLSDPSMKEIEAKAFRNAKEKALLIEKEAYEKGFAQGEKDGFELGQKSSETILHQLQKLFIEIGSRREDLYKKYEKELLQLVFCLTRRILQQDLPLPEDVITKTLQAAFHYVKEQKKVLLYLNPKDHEFLLSRPQSLPFAQETLESEGVKIIADSTITPGGCYLETSCGDIDATLESQLAQLFSLLWDKFEKTGFLSGRLGQ
jgi:flagellar assembly protein FliH